MPYYIWPFKSCLLPNDQIIMSYRTQQINSVIQHQIAELIQREIDKDLFGLVTVTLVDTSKDLSNCKVWISTMKKEKRKELLRELNKQIYKIQKTINRNLYCKKVPKIIFKIDENPDYVDNIENKLKNL